MPHLTVASRLKFSISGINSLNGYHNNMIFLISLSCS
ncbi:MAG: hypothetical protein BWX87_02258 [Bacteroidetes bacterium ADurb.Bin123]|nr:MAG: hypothetical protein BWX87_02258 [Bacteroidetes bacterium ADurb.Bin123]